MSRSHYAQSGIWKVTDRSFLTWQILDATMRMQATPDSAEKLKWARVMNKARRERGDFDQIIEAKRAHLDNPGERHD